MGAGCGPDLTCITLLVTSFWTEFSYWSISTSALFSKSLCEVNSLALLVWKCLKIWLSFMDFTVYRILCWDLFSFYTLKILSSCLLVSIFDEKAAIIAVNTPFGNRSLFTDSFHYFFSCGFAVSLRYEWARGHPDIWSDLFLGVSLRVFGDDT